MASKPKKCGVIEFDGQKCEILSWTMDEDAITEEKEPRQRDDWPDYEITGKRQSIEIRYLWPTSREVKTIRLWLTIPDREGEGVPINFG